MNWMNYILIAIVIVCAIFLIGCFVKKRPDLLVDFGLRALLGATLIYIIDFILRSRGYDFTVGINGVTVLSGGLLGFPGIILFYAISIYYSFV